jgi:hypothetical protein
MREKNWLKDHGARYSRVVKYEAEHGAEFYLSKASYAWKRGEVDVSANLGLELSGQRVCGKALHADYIKQITLRPHVDLQKYRWSR